MRADGDCACSAGMRPRLFTLGLALVLAGAGGGWAAELRASRPEVKKAVVTVIEAQLAAFRSGDVSNAYGYSAASLRAQTSLRAFAAIVQANYPEIWSNQRVEYGLVRDDGSRARVLVEVFGRRESATFEYVLIRERSGWRIGSIMRHDPRDKGNAGVNRAPDDWLVSARSRLPGSATA